MAKRSSDVAEVELSSDGSMLHPYFYRHSQKSVTKPNLIWKDRLEYVGMVRGRSMLQFEWRSLQTGKTFFMLSSTFDELMKQENSGSDPCYFSLYTHSSLDKSFSKMILLGKFTFEEKGGSYGIKPVYE